MLVDLGRNDLGRIARIGSVQVNQLMAVERYSHVMHLVSDIRAQLADGRDGYDVLKATFPAGTLTGAPKVRAMEIIAELEPDRRGPYGGAVGYFGYGGNLDFCITIRTMLIEDGQVSIQAGAGIVADSDPEAEYRETQGKAAGMIQAIRLAEQGFGLYRPPAARRKGSLRRGCSGERESGLSSGPPASAAERPPRQCLSALGREFCLGSAVRSCRVEERS
jgi:anthranilate synthase component 1